METKLEGMVKINLNHIYSIVKEIQATNSRNNKMAILSKYKDDEDFKFWLNTAFNPFTVFGIQKKKLDRVSKVVNMDNSTVTMMHVDFGDIVAYLKAHNTGREEDVVKVIQYLSTLPHELRQFAQDSLTKSVKIGASVKSINKVFGKGFIPEFNVQLAKKYFDEKNKLIKKYRGEFWLTQKLDGGRVVAINKPDGVSFFTRQGQPIYGLVDLEKEFESLPYGWVYDGELLLKDDGTLASKDLYRETMKESRKDGEKHGLIFNVFDVLPLGEFQAGKSRANYNLRRKSIEGIFSDIWTLKWIKKVPVLYHGRDWDKVDEYLDQEIAKKHEGVMVNLDKPYECKRTRNILKVKKFQTADVKIVDLVEGQGKYIGMLGAAVANFPCDDGTLSKFEIGSGWSDELRKKVWDNKNEYIGKIIEIGYFEISKNSKTGKESLRFPIFKRLRLDKTEESWY